MTQARRLQSYQYWEATFSEGVLTIDTAGLVVTVPRSALALPDCVLDPLLCMLVESICDVLLRYPRLDVIALHFLYDLEGILGNAEQGACHRSVFNGPVHYISIFLRSSAR